MRTLISTLILLMLPVFAYADWGKSDVNKNVNTNTNTSTSTLSNTNTLSSNNEGVSLVGGDSKAYAFAHALGDVDINQCLGSTQWGTIIVSAQKLVLNKWCAAETYDKKGMHSMAARIRCQIPEINKLFDDPQQCVLENTWTPPPADIPPPGPGDEETRPGAVGAAYEYADDVPSAIDIEQSVAMEVYEEHIETLEERVARIERGNRIAAKKAQEQREYAQHIIMRLDNDPEK